MSVRRSKAILNFLILFMAIVNCLVAQEKKAENKTPQLTTTDNVQKLTDSLLTLPQAIKIAEANYPAIKAREAELKSSQSDLRATKTQYLPAVLMQDQATYGSINAVRGSFIPNAGMALPISGGISDNSTNMQGVYGSYCSAVINWSVFNFGKIKANVDASKAGVKWADSQYQNELFQHEVQVSDAYLLLLVAQKIVRVAENNLERVRVLRDAIKAFTNSGIRPGVDSSLVNAEYSKAKIFLLQSKSTETAKRLHLIELLGLLQQKNIIVDTMAFLSSQPQDFVADVNAYKNSPILKIKETEITLYQRMAIAKKRSFLPSINLLGSYGGRGTGASNAAPLPATGFDLNSSPSAGLPFKAQNYLVGVYMLWNVFDYFRISNEYKSMSFKTERVKHEYEEESLKAKEELENAIIQMQLAIQQAMEAPIQYEAANNAYQQSKARYDAGLGTLTELSQTYYLLNSAAVDLSVARSNVWRSLLLKSAATGDITLFLKSIQPK
ncbi:MAG: TolC family protein [Bacteroidia bacterium]